MTDLRIALRMLLHHPGTSALAVLALSLGIGLTTTMFSIVNGALLRGLPFPDGDRLYHVAPFNVARQDDTDTPAHAIVALAARQHSFEQLAAFRTGPVNLIGADRLPERYRGAWVSVNLLRLLRVRPAIGRDFRPEEGTAGAAPVALISDKVWRDRLRSAPDVAGRPLRVNGTITTVVGVMAPGFGFPQTQDIWIAEPLDATLPSPSGQTKPAAPRYEMLGRLRDDVSVGEARAELSAIWMQLRQQFPDHYEKGQVVEIKTYIEEAFGAEIVAALLAMLIAVLGVLAIACTNVANLVLARAADRAHEVAVRTAIGATRWQVVRLMLVEVGALAVLGAVAGLAIAAVGVALFNRAIVDTSPPFWIDIRIDGAVVAFVTAVTVLAALLAGIVPALRASRADLTMVLNDQSRGSTSLRIGRLSRALVLVEMALSFGLLVTAALAVRSIVSLSRLDVGFAIRDVWIARLALPDEDYPDADRREQFASRLLERLSAIPGVERASLATNSPLGAPNYGLVVPGTAGDERERPNAWGVTVSPDYFRVLRVDLRAGRGFDARDRRGSQPVAIVNESFERTYFRDGAIGRQFALADADSRQMRTIVGVVPDLTFGRSERRDGFYLPLSQSPQGGLLMLLDTSGPPLAVTEAVRRSVRDLDPNLPIFNANTLEGSMRQNAWAYRVFGTLFMVFGFAALFLALVGLYGVMSFFVHRRTQEIGIRMALGAVPGDVIYLVLRRGILPVTGGIVMGVGLAGLLSSALREFFFGISPHDPMTFTVVGLVLLVTGLIACFVPARRAAAVDPLEALRYN
jgi:predicted permease